MKHVFIVPLKGTDVQSVIKTQAEKYIPADDLVFWHVHNDYKKTLQKLRNEDLGEHFVFCPPWTVLLDEPVFKTLDIVVGEMEQQGLSYTRLRKVGNSSSRKIDGTTNLYPDAGASFFLAPHIWKTSAFHAWIDDGREVDMLYWQSLEVGKINGAFFYQPADQPDMKLSYWRCGAYHAVSDILADEKWSDTHLNFNGEPLRPILANLDIDPEIRGIGSIGGCCYDLG